MFEQRLKTLLWILGVLALGVVARLVQMQVLRADTYREEARKALLRPVRVLPCVRGRILDRSGRVLAENQPCWDVSVPFGILAGEPEYLYALAEQLKTSERGRSSPVTEAEVDSLRSRIAAMWPTIAQVTAVGLDELAEQRERIVRRVRQIKEAVREKQGLDRRIAEERMNHPVVRGLEQAAAVEARIVLASYPWVQVTPGTRRRYAREPALAHVLGRLADASTGDALVQDLAGGPPGVAGVERLADERLRGTPGQITENIDGRPESPPVEPVNGEDVRLAIDAPLQQQIEERLAATARQYPLCSGAAVVVISLPGREALALVSHPAFDPNADAAERRRLRLDRKCIPLQFRAVGELYPPGSTVKPLVAAEAMAEGVIGPETEFVCGGRLFDGVSGFRCTGVHGPLTVMPAITHSCNVFFYHVGEISGVARLQKWFEATGFSVPSGTGLREDIAGRMPERANKGDARNAAIGQGELAVTPAHVANLMATVATGEYRPITILHDETPARPGRSLGIPASVWSVVRAGLYNVVNEPSGTAFGKAEPPPEPWILLGKTGSAEGWQREMDRLYTVQWPDGRREEIVATDAADLKRKVASAGGFQIAGWRSHSRWPPNEQKDITHAWFAGYVIHREDATDLGSPPRRGAAFAILIEYAGHGGAVAGPLAGEIARMLAARLGS